MKAKLSLLALIVVCIAQLAYATIPVPHVKNDFRFLRQLGIDVSQLNIMGDKVVLDEHVNYYPLSQEVIPLLDKVRHMDYYINHADGRDGGYSIVGVRDLYDMMLVLYSVEYGDGANIEMGMYDDNGHLCDFLDMGYWSDSRYCNIDDGPESDANISINTHCVFHEDETFTLVVSGEMHPINAEPSESNLMGRITKMVHIGYKNRHFVVEDIKMQYSDPELKMFFPFEDLINLRYSPSSDTKKFTQLNQIIEREDVADDLKDEYSEASYLIVHTLADWLETSTGPLMSWLTYHQDSDNNHLLYFVKDSYKSGVADGAMLKYVVSQMQPNKVKKYATQLFQQWDREIEENNSSE
ncbi:MAG: hypothetical protein J5565_04905 [Muribaculaceae bacterium]|nr:hypothetical protein [Muribaculaceae bacterium]